MDNIRPYLYTLILVVCALLGKAQPALEARLHSQLKTATADTAKARIYAELARISSNGKTDSLRAFAFKSLAIYNKTKDDYSGMYGLNAVGAYYRSVNKFDSALYCYEEARRKAEKLGNWRRVISGYSNLSNIYCDIGKFDKGVECGYKALAIAEKTKDAEGLAKIHKSLLLPYHEMEMWPEVIYHANAALSYFIPHNDSLNSARCYNVLGIAYIQQKKYALAEDVLNKSIALNDSTGVLSTYYSVLTNLGLLYDETGRDDEALAIYLKNYDLLEELGNTRQTGIITNNIAHIYLQKGDKANAEKYFLISLDISKEQQSPIDIRDAAVSLATLSAAKGNYAKAFEYQQLAYAYNDTVTNIEKTKAAAEIKTLYEVGKKEEENRRLLQDAQIKDLQINQQLIVIIGLGIALLVIIAGGLYFYRQRRLIGEQREKILEQRLLQLQLNPHFIFNSLLAIQDYIYSSNATQASSYLSKFAKLMRATLEHSRKETIPLPKEIESLENYLALQKLRLGDKLTYSITVDENIDIFNIEVPPMLLQPFIENAVEHGVQMKEGNGKVSVAFKELDGMLNIKIADDGPGIDSQNAGSAEHQSLSVEIINERLQLIGKRNKKKPKLSITGNAGLGTVVELSFAVEA